MWSHTPQTTNISFPIVAVSKRHLIHLSGEHWTDIDSRGQTRRSIVNDEICKLTFGESLQGGEPFTRKSHRMKLFLYFKFSSELCSNFLGRAQVQKLHLFKGTGTTREELKRQTNIYQSPQPKGTKTSYPKLIWASNSMTKLILNSPQNIIPLSSESLAGNTMALHSISICNHTNGLPNRLYFSGLVQVETLFWNYQHIILFREIYVATADSVAYVTFRHNRLVYCDRTVSI